MHELRRKAKSNAGFQACGFKMHVFYVEGLGCNVGVLRCREAPPYHSLYRPSRTLLVRSPKKESETRCSMLDEYDMCFTVYIYICICVYIYM